MNGHRRGQPLNKIRLTGPPRLFPPPHQDTAFKEAIRPGGRALRLKIPRAEVAEFLRRQLSDARYLRRAVGISY